MKTNPETRAFLAAMKHEVRSAQELLEALTSRNRMDAEILSREPQTDDAEDRETEIQAERKAVTPQPPG